MKRYIVLSVLLGSCMLIKGCSQASQAEVKSALQTVVVKACNRPQNEYDAIRKLCLLAPANAAADAACALLSHSNNTELDACQTLTDIDALIEAVDAAKAKDN